MRLVLVLVLSAAACAPTMSYLKTNSMQPTAQVAPDKVEVLTMAPQGRSYIEVGVLGLDDPAVASSGDLTPALLARFRRSAGRTGCSAIVLQGARHTDAGLASSDLYHATCLLYR